MGDKWREYRIGEIAEIVGGGTPSTKEEDNFGGTIPWLTPKDLSGYPYRYISHGERNITEKGLSNSSAKLLPEKTVLLTTRAPVGYVAIAKNPVTTNQGFRSLVLHEGFDPEFVYYLLKINTEFLKNHASGTTFGELSGSTLKNLKFLFPPLPEQKAIASILGALDDKIELNRKMNETLEAMARAIFKSCFSYPFDGLKYLQAETPSPDLTGHPLPLGEGRGEGELELVDSPLGKIPKGWRVKSIGDVVEIIKGRSYKSSELMPSSTALVTLKSVARGGGYRPEGLKSFVGDYKPEQELKVGELVIACTDVTQAAEVIGKPAIVRGDSRFETLVASLDLLIVRSTTKYISIPFLYLLFRTDDFQAHIYAHTNGTTVLHLDKKSVPSFKFVCPPDVILQKFSEVSIPLFNKIETNETESRTLASIRDALLPKLLSGEIRVKDAERFVEKRT